MSNQKYYELADGELKETGKDGTTATGTTPGGTVATGGTPYVSANNGSSLQIAGANGESAVAVAKPTASKGSVTTTAESDAKDTGATEADAKDTGITEADTSSAGTTLEQLKSNADAYNTKVQEVLDGYNEFVEQQKQLANDQTDLTISQIEQQKEQAEKDTLEEQSAAYVDYQKQTAKHGVNAEQMAGAGMTGSGYSESSKVAMYTAYQNRVATARASLQEALVSYNNAIAEAKLTNSATLAEIAYNAYQQQVALALEAFQYNNSLLLSIAQLEEDQRQYNESMQLARDELAEDARQFDASLEASKSNSTAFTDSSGQNGDGGDEPDTSVWTIDGYTTTNTNSDTYIKIDGESYTAEEVYEGLQDGSIICVEDEENMTLTFKTLDEVIKEAAKEAKAKENPTGDAIADDAIKKYQTGFLTKDQAAKLIKLRGFDPDKYL